MIRSTFDIDVSAMVDGYVAAALWADCVPICACDPGVCNCESGGLERLRVDAESLAYVTRLVSAFVAAAGRDLVVYANGRENRLGLDVFELLGHDLRLDAGGHGSGFWDHDPDPDWRERANADDLAKFGAARARLSALASSGLFSTEGGGDCYQVDDESARIEPASLLQREAFGVVDDPLAGLAVIAFEDEAVGSAVDRAHGIVGYYVKLYGHGFDGVGCAVLDVVTTSDDVVLRMRAWLADDSIEPDGDEFTVPLYGSRLVVS